MRRVWLALVVLLVALVAAPAQAQARAQAAGCWQQFPGSASAVYHGGDGSIWALGPVVNGVGMPVLRWDGLAWVNTGFYTGRAEMAVGPTGQPWVIGNIAAGDYTGIYRLVGSTWERVPGEAYDISIGADGSVYAVGTTPVVNGFEFFQWNGSGWTQIATPAQSGAWRVAVDRLGRPWIGAYDKLYWRVNGAWQDMSRGPEQVTDLAIGGGTNGYPEQMWRSIFSGNRPEGNRIQRWNGDGWTEVEGGGFWVSVDRTGRAWHVNPQQNIYYWTCS